MFYSAKNAKIKVNGQQFICSDVQLSYQSQLQPNYYVGDSFNTNYSAQDGIGGSFRFSYYLTGSDPLKSYLNSTGLMTAEICGITFGSGCLKSFSFSAVPNTPVKPIAEIVFFDKANGTFTPETVSKDNIQTLNYSNIQLTPLSNYNQEDISNITQINYSYSADIQPYYTVNTNSDPLSNIIPFRVVFGPREIVTEIICDSLETKLPITGAPLGVTINLKHPSLSINETYTSSGTLYSKEISANVGQNIQTTYTIIQNKVSEAPVITLLDPILNSWNNSVNIFGINFSNLIKVLIGSLESTNIVTATDTSIFCEVPAGTEAFPYVTVQTLYGTAVSSTTLNVAQPTARIDNDFTVQRLTRPPAASLPGEEEILHISGDYFQKTTEIKFGNVIAPFEIIAPTLVRVRVPRSGVTGPLSVYSRGISGLSDNYVIFPPLITGFTLPTGITGDTVSILGSNLGTITKVRFGEVNANFSIVNTGKINATVPSGNVMAQIYVSGSGFSGLSPNIFIPKIIFSSIVPPSGKKGEAVEIRGHNFIPEIMNLNTGNYYNVSFNGIRTSMYRTSDTRLNGLIPSGNTTGPFFIIDVSGSLSSTASGFFSGIINPELSGIVPTEVYSGKINNFSLIGKYLSVPQIVRFSGLQSNNSSQIFNITDKLTGDFLSIKTISTGYRFSHPTGYYRAGFINYAGTGYLTGFSGELTSGFRIAHPPNLALQGVSSQSSNYTGLGSGLFYSYFAMDRITSGTQSDKFLAWTNSGTDPYWQVDLRRTFEVGEIKVYNRFDYQLGASSPLTDFDLSLLANDGSTVVWTTNYASAETSAMSFLVPNLTGRFVKLLLNGSNKSLALAEVEVY